ncbi:MAG: hypothetical protein ACI9Z9_000681 [Litorivivens sp.]
MQRSSCAYPHISSLWNCHLWKFSARQVGNSIVSLLYVMEDGDSAELSAVGNEGIPGILLFMGSATTSSRAVVLSAGIGY